MAPDEKRQRRITLRRCASRSALVASLVGASASASACSLLAGIEDFTLVAANDASPSADVGTPIPNIVVDADIADSLDAPEPPDAAVDAASSCPACSGTCVQGQCYPMLVVSGMDDPQSIAVVGNLVVYAEYARAVSGAGTIRACPLTGCTGTAFQLASNLTSPVLRQAGTNGVVTFSQIEKSGALAAGPLREVLANGSLSVIADVPGLQGAAASATTAAWFSSSAFFACTRDDCAASTVQVINGNATFAGVKPVVSMSGARAVWAVQGKGFESLVVPTGNGFRAGGLNDDIADLGIDGSDVYFIATNRNKLVVQPLASGAAARDLADANGATALTYDATTVYLAGPSGIRAVDRVSGAVALRVNTAAKGVAVSGGFLYWTEPTTGRVLKGPK